MTRLKVAFRNFAKARNRESNYNFLYDSQALSEFCLSAYDLKIP
jgi:hypothetical protein